MKKKLNKKIIISVICMILAPVILVGIVLAILPRKADDNADGTEQVSDAYDADTTQEPCEEKADKSEGHTPIPDLDDGNEIYLDADVIDRLQQMENAGKEYEVNLILDTMLPLINEFIRREYTPLAICQIQRFYITFYESIGDIDHDLLCDKIGACVPSDGIAETEFPTKAFEQFGFDKNTDYSYIYSAEAVT